MLCSLTWLINYHWCHWMGAVLVSVITAVSRGTTRIARRWCTISPLVIVVVVVDFILFPLSSPSVSTLSSPLCVGCPHAQASTISARPHASARAYVIFILVLKSNSLYPSPLALVCTETSTLSSPATRAVIVHISHSLFSHFRSMHSLMQIL